ncbi:phosphate ABC transporter permease subunit PstC [Paenactinomyces guangxiensis]|uniref:Phosphate transport system permease protein n=1 Tax=Paenactinomyces guangxiensis TaxID=1490290 RepID=A0A7W2AA26_9BACL|nr:phosphate ABC transporter permease subunit PstC [Paenactinomyces guangxiensis]MBA4495513.1 phosphate ABC transporter permease subunit PstC [Paenactinomyces guangxiensis]MBH8592771.1 phosphate ABC transporter permease subunit PstC [Paenactinomyces guangxiensis]
MSRPANVVQSGVQNRFRKKRTWRNSGESLIPKFLLLCALISVLTTVGIIFTLIFETVSFFQSVSFVEFITGTKWTALFREEQQKFGVLPLVTGTLLVTAGAAVVAIPIGLASAIYLSEYAPDRVRRVVKPVLEILAGIPTIVYGTFAITFVTPLLRNLIPDLNFLNALSASIVVGIMIIPMIASLSEDAMRAVPQSVREAAYGLGSTRLEVAMRIVVPAALSGIMASFVLALSRAIGETMIVTIAAGATPNLTFIPTESIQTMTAYMVQAAMGDISYESIAYKSIYAVGMMLFLFTLVMNLLAQFISRRFKEGY